MLLLMQLMPPMHRFLAVLLPTLYLLASFLPPLVRLTPAMTL
jgi:hypothetical protein